ncbi:MAG: alpha/beta fold hydrolase [Candidatus Obscuribacter sp.]|nr:alpha/beta fold hydrolase [Candidatus Obscuribacter sp.]
MNQAKAIRTICLLLLIGLLALGVTNQSLAEECVTNVQSVSPSIGSRCTEDPSCVIVGGTHMLEWKSPAPVKIVVVCIHGLGLCARAYKPLAQELSAVGIDGFGVNVRGFGPDRDRPDRAKLNCVETVGDVSKLLTSIHTEHPDYKVFLVGESMGGALAIRIVAENPGLVDGVICSAPAWKLLKMRGTAVKGVFELFLFPGNQTGPAGRGVMHQATTDPKLTEHWLTDPSHKLKLSFGEAASFLSFIKKTDTYAKQLAKPVLIVQGLNDHLVSPKAVAKLFKDIPTSNKTFLIDGKGEHLVLEEGRFSPTLTAKLIAWLKADSGVQSSPYTVEVIDDQALSPEEKRHLSKLRRLAKTQYAVKWAGALRNIHQGIDFGGQIDLAPLVDLPHLYAVGPLENLQGEVTIWDGKPLISRIKNQALQVDNDLTGKACFLVYGQARAWKKLRLSAPLKMSEVDDAVKQEAIKHGINTGRPFPFLIEGSAKFGRYHVMNRTETVQPSPGPASHDAAKVHLTIENAPVELLGFYSEHHQGIFTHHSSFVHLHIKSPDDKIAGHLEDVELEPGARLLLPKSYSR